MVKLKIACISLTVRDRAISTKFLTRGVSLRSIYSNVKKISEKNFWKKKFLKMKIFEIFLKFLKFEIFLKFLKIKIFEKKNFWKYQKLQNTKMLISRKPCEIERFRWNFWPVGYLCRVSTLILKKILKKIFENFWNLKFKIFLKFLKKKNFWKIFENQNFWNF